MPAPIALFCFRRPDHLVRTLEALAANHGATDHDLIAFQDGPRDDSDVAGVQAVRTVLNRWAAQGAFRSFTITEQSTNLGLRRSLVHGVTSTCRAHDRVIVVEDDLVTSPWFLAFMRDGLETYAAEPQVASIHGHVEAVDGLPGGTFFQRGADCWGWATWQRAWQCYRDDAAGLLSELDTRQLGDRFDLHGARPLRRMLADADAGLVDSWAIRWHASAFLANLHTLYPTRSLVTNIGQDGSGTHCSCPAVPPPHPSAIRIPVQRIAVAEDPAVIELLRRHFHAIAPPWWRRLARRLGVLPGRNGQQS